MRGRWGSTPVVAWTTSLTLAAGVLLAVPVPAQATADPQLPLPTSAFSATRAETLGAKLQSTLDAQRLAVNVPGATAAVIFPDGSRWSGGSGRAALNPARSAGRDTPFVAGSITKTYVAAVILRLVEEGVLELDGTLDRWLPAYPGAKGITLRQLMGHTSGVFNYFEHSKYNDAVFGHPNRHWQPQEILDTFQRAPYFAPDAGYHYSNTGFVLLGMVIEKATGSSFGSVLADRFLKPLGLARTSFQGDGPPPSTAAQGYLLKDGAFREVSDSSGYRPTRSAATVAWAAGGMVGSAPDIATWGHALYGGRLLTPASMKEMLDYRRSPYANGTYALGTRTRLLDGRRMFGHTGSLRGFVAAMWHFPQQATTVVVLTNRGRINANTIADALARRALADTTPPSVPQGLKGEPLGYRRVGLSWQPSTDDSGGTIRYRVLRDGKRIATVTATSYIDRPAVAGTYSYKVRAVDAAGNKSAFSVTIKVRARRGAL
jgi:D-alanyl-D-alanine carboxypeptidase